MVRPDDPIKNFEPLWGDWYADELLSEGGYARAYRLVRHDGGKAYYSVCKHITLPAHSGDMLARLRSEIDAMYALRGEDGLVAYEDHIVTQKAGAPQWHVFIRMETLFPLSAYMAGGPMEPEEVRRLGIELCGALEACEAHGFVHGSVREDNVFLSASSAFKLGDFGLAQEAAAPAAVPLHIAPEVYAGRPGSAAADVYSLGILMYKLLNGGRAPFEPAAPASVTNENAVQAFALRMQGFAPPWPANGDDALRSAVMKAISFAPEARFAAAAEMKAALVGRSVLGTPSAAPQPVYTPGPSPAIAAQDFAGNVGYAGAPDAPYAYAQPQASAPDYGYPPVQPQPAPRKKPRVGVILGIVGGAVLLVALLAVLLRPKGTRHQEQIQSGAGA